MFYRNCVTMLAILAVAAMTCAALAQDDATATTGSAAVSAKNIYFEPEGPPPPPDTPPPPVPNVAVRFTVEVHPREGGAVELATADRKFHSGERTRFRVSTSASSYLYIAYEGSMGDRALLFPSWEAGRDNKVSRHSDKVVPSTNGYFTFDANPGVEKIVVVVSPTRIADLEELSKKRIADQQASKTLSPAENEIWSKVQKDLTGAPSGVSSKNIVYEPETSGADTGGYYAHPTTFTEPVVICIALNHVP